MSETTERISGTTEQIFSINETYSQNDTKPCHADETSGFGVVFDSGGVSTGGITAAV